MPISPPAASSISGVTCRSRNSRAVSLPPSRYIAATSDSNTSANSEGRDRRAGRHPLAEDEELLHPQVLADLGAGLAADDDRLDPRQIAFEILRVLPEEQLADDGAQNGVAKEFQPFVGRQAVFGPRGVRQRGLQQMFVVKSVADPLFTTLQQRLKGGADSGSSSVCMQQPVYRFRRFFSEPLT